MRISSQSLRRHLSLMWLTIFDVGAAQQNCRYIPGDSGWPSKSDWDLLNSTVEGRLIETVPQAHVCHPEPYDALNQERCDILRETWDYAQTFIPYPAEIINPIFQNQSCNPFTPLERPCELGNYASYSINVTVADDVLAGIRFAKQKNVRLVIMNTGHDYMGKSTGKGSLSLWTHNLKHTEIIESYYSEFYNGPAIKMGAGIISGEMLEIVARHGYRAVGGTCASVGVVGGYAGGGGHSILSGLYGLAADNVLEWEIITARGEHIKATPSNNHSDLYWAMSGGGAGVWGVVLSMTYKIHPDGPIGGARLSFNTTSIDLDRYWEAVEAWFAWMPDYVDGMNGGNTVEYLISASSFNAISFTVPGQGREAVDFLLGPYLAELARLGVPYVYSSHTSVNFYDHFERDLGPLPYGPWEANTLFSNRLFPRAVVQNATTNAALAREVRNMAAYLDGYFFLGCESLSMPHDNHPPNSLLPAWRDTIGICTVIGYWNWTIPFSEMLARKEHLAFEIVPAFEGVTPGSGSYLNEVDSYYNGDWKREFYGHHYDRLLSVKNKYDPDHFFYAYTGVGSDSWTTDGAGRLCRTFQ
ncbi:hypothetical protein S7711_04167 [Stachybotrys chartarum IBT 7711]|uniref:FAD-binding PCMH-type domain-containing protein n=1 Tax=Stachybotrys chartarum (strain CBS 109288 / IBT 7711) TaxID=1280523 RepID=A0A084B6M2_STACB|nr:hypothetical protein S7711_04167 [Stachybotrys chartarum IBT 7711]